MNNKHGINLTFDLLFSSQQGTMKNPLNPKAKNIKVYIQHGFPIAAANIDTLQWRCLTAVMSLSCGRQPDDKSSRKWENLDVYLLNEFQMFPTYKGLVVIKAKHACFKNCSNIAEYINLHTTVKIKDLNYIKCIPTDLTNIHVII